MLIEPKCAVCGEPSARVEILRPHESPAKLDEWEPRWRAQFLKDWDRSKWRLLFSSIGGSNGVAGDAISDEKATRWLDALQEPLTYESVHSLEVYDDLGFCGECKVPYCDTHWNVSSSGYGRCAKGHGKSLDPLWSP